jgi:hypothetical protein
MGLQETVCIGLFLYSLMDGQLISRPVTRTPVTLHVVAAVVVGP